jgi:hypothetical protein
MAAVVSYFVAIPIAMGLYYTLTQTGIPMMWLMDLLHASGIPVFEGFADGVINQARFEQAAVDNTAIWHYVVSDDFTRHGLREIGVGLAAGFGLSAFKLNPLSKKFLKKASKKVGLVDWVEIHLRIPNWKDNTWRAERNLPPLSAKQAVAAWLVWQWVYAIPLMYGLLYGIAALSRHLQWTSPEYTDLIVWALNGSIVYGVIGFMVSPLARRPLAPVMADLFDQIAEWWVRIGYRGERWYYQWIATPQFAEILRRKAEAGADGEAVKYHQRLSVKLAFLGVVLVLAALCALGWYIRLVIIPASK